MSNHPEDTRKQPAYQKAVSDISAGGNVTVGDTHLIINNQSQQLTPEEKQDQKLRRSFLNSVYKQMCDRLDDNEKLKSDRAIKLVLETRYEFSCRKKRPNTHTDIENILAECKDGNGKKLLILGPPGAGKTITLWQLGKKFYEQIKSDEEKILEKPIPVVFQLSSWKDGQSIEDLLIQQLRTIYGVDSPELAKTWVKKGIFFFLLDGLDELNFEKQIECVKKINEFSGLNNIVVCSHLEQYEELSRFVSLEGIEIPVCIKSLEDKQINKYLAKWNKSGLKQVLDEDKTLGELAKIPFWLDIMTDVDESLPREGSSEDRQKKLFDTYIEKRFDKTYEVEKKERLQRSVQTDQLKSDREKTQLKYDKKKTIKWLTWLASKSKSVFLIEEMQPSWLTEEQKRLYLIATLCNGMLLGLLFGTPFGVILEYYLSYFQGLPLGLPVKGLVIGVAAGLILGTAAQYFLKVHEHPIKTPTKRESLSWEKAKNNFWELLKASAEDAMKIGGGVFLICLLINLILPIGIVGAITVAAYFLIATLIPRLVSNSSFEKDEVRTLKPNQGILDALNKSCQIAIITTCLITIIATLGILIIYHNNLHLGKLIVPLILGLCAALVTGGVAAFIHDSGRACQQHLALRIVLYLEHVAK